MTTVYLIGTGPGDPGLITVRGLDCLQRADVVVHDHGVDAHLLRQARADAEIIDVGGAGAAPLAQEAISYLVVEKAREGKVVARLKCGDPFVFDRGGEEALFIRENGIPLEMVPGVPLSVASPAYAGIPITYPGGDDALTIVRGFDETGKAMPDVDWQAIARVNGTVLCFASAPQLPRILDALVAGGCPEATPAAVILDGTRPTQRTEAGTVGSVQRTLLERPLAEPGLLIVGRVVAFREHLRWFDRLPLFGRRVIVTRPEGQAADLVDRLTALGARALEAPMIRIRPADDTRPLVDAAARAHEFEWIVFTSVNAVDYFMDAIFAGGRDARALGPARICAVGPATATRLGTIGLRPDLVPQEFKASAAFDALSKRVSLKGAKVLLPRADIGREVLASRLRAAGAEVTEIIAYRTVADDGQRAGNPDIYRLLLEGRIDAVTFASASAVRAFAKVYGVEQSADLLRHTTVAVIGPATAEAATALGIGVSIQPEAYTVPALVAAIAAHFADAPPKA
jgi:uroporphyrinogen III methyltransferase/synthase